MTHDTQPAHPHSPQDTHDAHDTQNTHGASDERGTQPAHDAYLHDTHRTSDAHGARDAHGTHDAHRTDAHGAPSPRDTLLRLAAIIDSRKGGDPDASYVARLFHKGDDAVLKKIGEEATEVVLAAKDARHGGEGAGGSALTSLVGEMADLWFHCLVALAHFGLNPADVLAELERREGLSGLEEKALRKQRARERSGD